jgi:hypothetical protein
MADGRRNPAKEKDLSFYTLPPRAANYQNQKLRIYIVCFDNSYRAGVQQFQTFIEHN